MGVEPNMTQWNQLAPFDVGHGEDLSLGLLWKGILNGCTVDTLQSLGLESVKSLH